MSACLDLATRVVLECTREYPNRGHDEPPLVRRFDYDAGGVLCRCRGAMYVTKAPELGRAFSPVVLRRSPGTHHVPGQPASAAFVRNLST